MFRRLINVSKSRNDWTIPWYGWMLIAVLVLQVVIAITQAGTVRIRYVSAGDTAIAIAIYALMIVAVVRLARRGRPR